MNHLSKCVCDSLFEIGERYRKSLPKIEENTEAIRQKGVLKVESKERVQTRKALLRKFDPEIALERVLGESDFLPSNYFTSGERTSRSVCRVHILDSRGRPKGFGTAFLVGPSLILTNWHVLENLDLAERSYVEFDFEFDLDGFPLASEIFPLDRDAFFHVDKALDFCLVALETKSRNGRLLSAYPPLRLIEESGKALLHENVTIIQHPRGSHKQVALRNNKVLNYHKTSFVHYTTDTEPGSSGSPVLNDQMEVVALHHAGVPKTDGQLVLKKDGSPFRTGDDADDIEWVANEGVRISSIFKYIRAQSWSKKETSYLEQQLEIDLDDAHESFSFEQLAQIEKITASELLDRVYDDDLSDEEIEKYFVLGDESLGMAPVFKPNPELVVDDSTTSQESALLLNAVNWLSKSRRQKRYKKRIRKNPNATRIVAEGDSWFQYPIKLHDVIDHLMDKKDLAVLCFSEAGDLIGNMVARAEFMRSLETEKPEFFLISGAGNDLVGNEGLRKYVKNAATNNAEDYLKKKQLKKFTDYITKNYKRLLRMVIKIRPEITILCHGYSYAIPDSGKWLGKPLQKEGITNPAMQTEIVRLIMDEVGEAIRRAVMSFPQNSQYLDLRNTVPANGWHDELHPEDYYYGKVAAIFEQAIRS